MFALGSDLLLDLLLVAVPGNVSAGFGRGQVGGGVVAGVLERSEGVEEAFGALVAGEGEVADFDLGGVVVSDLFHADGDALQGVEAAELAHAAGVGGAAVGGDGHGVVDDFLDDGFEFVGVGFAEHLVEGREALRAGAGAEAVVVVLTRAGSRSRATPFRICHAGRVGSRGARA